MANALSKGEREIAMNKLTGLLFVFLAGFSLFAFAAENGNAVAPDSRPFYAVLGFGAAVVGAEVWLILKMRSRWTPYGVIRLIGLTLTVTAAVALVMRQSESEHVTAVVGMLGSAELRFGRGRRRPPSALQPG